MSAPTLAEAFEIVRAPFHVGEVEWRIQSSGEKGDAKPPWAIVVPYVTARSVHDRLDEAFGPDGWHTEFKVMEVPGGVSGVICRMSYRDPDPDVYTWQWKENGAGQTHIEPFKGGLSDSEKRAFEGLGGGRYLYSLGTQFAETSRTRSEKCPEYAKTKGGTVFYWGAPLLPDHAIPRVKAEVQGLAEDALGESFDEPMEYPLFDRVIASMAHRPGISELRGAQSYAKELGMDDDSLVAFAAEIGVDLHDLTKAHCIKLRDMMRAKVQGGS